MMVMASEPVCVSDSRDTSLDYLMEFNEAPLAREQSPE